jgi:hypothetical protein
MTRRILMNTTVAGIAVKALGVLGKATLWMGLHAVDGPPADSAFE